MTVLVTDAASIVSGDDATTSWSVDWKVYDDDTVYVSLIEADGTATLLTEDTDYTLDRNLLQESGPGATLVYPLADDYVTAPLATGDRLLISRVLRLLQDTDLVKAGQVYPSALETGFDKEVMMLQQIAEIQEKMLRVAPYVAGFDGTLPVPVAGKYIRINSTNDGLIFDGGNDAPSASGQSFDPSTAPTIDATNVQDAIEQGVRAKWALIEERTMDNTLDSIEFYDLGAYRHLLIVGEDVNAGWTGSPGSYYAPDVSIQFGYGTPSAPTWISGASDYAFDVGAFAHIHLIAQITPPANASSQWGHFCVEAMNFGVSDTKTVYKQGYGAFGIAGGFNSYGYTGLFVLPGSSRQLTCVKVFKSQGNRMTAYRSGKMLLFGIR